MKHVLAKQFETADSVKNLYNEDMVLKKTNDLISCNYF